MIEAGEVGAVFRVVDEASSNLRKIAEQLKLLDTQINAAKASFLELGKANFKGLIAGLGDTNKLLADLSKAAGMSAESILKIGGAGKEAFESMTGSADAIRGLFAGIGESAKISADAVASAYASASAKMVADLRVAMAEMKTLQVGSIRNRGSGGGSSGNGVTPAAGGHGGSNGFHVGRMGVPLGPVHGSTGSDAVIGGGVMVFITTELAKHASELAHVQQQLGSSMGNTPEAMKEVAKATNLAWAQSAKWGLKVEDVLKDIKEARLVFGSTEHAMNFIDPLENMRVVLNSIKEGRGNSATDDVYEMARAGELKGLTDPKEFVQYFDGMTKAMNASGGKIDAKSFMQATKYGKVSSFGWDEEFYTKYMPSMMQALGPSTSGTAMMSLFGTMVQGKASMRATKAMDEIGLIGDRSRLRYDKLGNATGFESGAIKGTDELVRNPYKWAQEFLLPLLEKKYGDISNPDNKSKAIAGLADLFGNRNSAEAVAEMALRGKSFNKDAAIIGQAQGLEAAAGFMANDPMANMRMFTAAWSNMLSAMGTDLVGPAIGAMKAMTDLFNTVDQFSRAHPEAAKAAGLATAGLGTAAVVGGVGSMLWKGLANLGRPLSWLFGGGGAAAGEATAGGAAAAGGGLLGFFGSALGVGGLAVGTNILEDQALKGIKEKLLNADPNKDKTPQQLYDELQKKAGGSEWNDLIQPMNYHPGYGGAGNDNRLTGIFQSGTEQGVLDGLISVSANAKAIIATWFGGGTGAGAGGGGGGGGGGFGIGRASYESGGGGSTAYGPGANGVLPALGGGQPRNLRNNNPGNIIDGAWARSQPGYAGSDGHFARFTSMEDGYRAANHNLDNYARRGLVTPMQIVKRWAPSADGNNPVAYANKLQRMTGLDPNALLGADPASRARMLRGMTGIEGSKMPYTNEQIAAALSGDYAGLNILAGHGATKGGAAQPGLIDVARMLQGADPGVGFTALNDGAHAFGLGSGPYGAHGQGRAFDAVMGDIEGGKAALRARLGAAGFSEGAWPGRDGDYSIEPGAGGGTGPHLHFQWNNAGAASRFHGANAPAEAERERRRASALSNLHAPAPSGGGQQAQVTNLHIDGKRIARAVSKHQVTMSTHPRSAPFHDAGHLYSSVDYGFATG
jgi:hypothetical protein